MTRFVAFFLVFTLAIPVAIATPTTKQDKICFTRSEISAIRKKNAERKTKIKQLENELEGCKRAGTKALEAEIIKRKRLEDDIRRMNPVLPWVIVGVVSAIAVGVVLIGVLR